MNRWRRIGMSAAGVSLMAGSALAVAQPASAVNQDGSFSLVAATGKCVEVIPDANGNFYAVGNRIQQRTCDGSPQQQWFLNLLPGDFRGIPNNERYYLVNRMTLQCLNDVNGGTANRNPVEQRPCSGSNSVWSLQDTNNPLGDQLVNETAARCLDVTDGSVQDGARLQIYACFDPAGNIAQHYTMR